ncbi:hypothetical protein HOP50_16g77670 [Chloropicon primus]|uniref:Macro domain-containing protein n=1 Tax=Chloropicon primus TaxID=1764295 RepID=A0A5B8MXY7_9CHLO|nr:hypothetical protein A3770_16p77390 [Chloropicon primus]UPR04426.1 hypothetical protein HOP50_16g77670 [Chloropicon primus]|eukprot:QDZ25221.1 hypothetical protein A3770_16p77390 [Chloropicon primus]
MTMSLMKATAIFAMLVTGSASALDMRKLLHNANGILPHKQGGGVGHHIAQAAAIGGAALDVAGAGTEAYGLATGDKNAQKIGAGELGVGTAAGVGGAAGAVATRCKWAVGDHKSDIPCHKGPVQQAVIHSVGK